MCIGIPRTNSTGKVLDAETNVTDTLPKSEEAICRGEYAVIRSLIRVLEVFKNLIFIPRISLCFDKLLRPWIFVHNDSFRAE